MPEFQVDDIVDITVKGVRIARPRRASSVTIIDEYGVPYQMPPQAAVELVAPAEWPPRPGDLWRGPKKYEGKILSGSSILWFARLDRNSDIDDRLELIPADGNLSSFDADPDAVLARFAPLTLVHREGGDTDA